MLEKSKEREQNWGKLYGANLQWRCSLSLQSAPVQTTPRQVELWLAWLFTIWFWKIMITCPWVSPGGFPGSNRTARPKSASTAVKSFFSKTFLLLKSLQRDKRQVWELYYGVGLNQSATHHAVISRSNSSGWICSFLLSFSSCFLLLVSVRCKWTALCCWVRSHVWCEGLCSCSLQELTLHFRHITPSILKPCPPVECIPTLSSCPSLREQHTGMAKGQRRERKQSLRRDKETAEVLGKSLSKQNTDDKMDHQSLCHLHSE